VVAAEQPDEPEVPQVPEPSDEPAVPVEREPAALQQEAPAADPEEVAIIAENISVRFRPYLDRSPTFRRSMARLRGRQAGEVVALDNVSFDVKRGEVLGVVGRNGAGKSTLMRVLAKTLVPDEGRVVVNGRTSTLLQLGVGFNPELSGRRNVYLGALASGLRKSVVDDRFDAIVDYSELGDAIDRPLKTYSSGMTSRLAFAIGMNLDPDILLLDEVLAVGDEAFRRKSRQTMEELVGRSGTIVFVSHNMGQMASFCDRVLWIHQGRVRRLGPSRRVIRAYRDSMRPADHRRKKPPPVTSPDAAEPSAPPPEAASPGEGEPSAPASGGGD
jgi:ABC-type polysaccharide/polyol phosphate transport system ATPase subunit